MSGRRATRATALAGLAGLAGAGCHHNYVILKPSELRHLDGFGEPTEGGVVTGKAAYQVMTDDGPLRFDDSIHLWLHLKPNDDTVGGKFRSISVDGPAFRGTLKSGEPVNVNLGDVTKIEASRLSVGKTAGLVVGLFAGALLLVGGALVAVGVSSAKEARGPAPVLP